ncbi:MAG: DNA repair protein RecO [Lachnospira sp.]
MSEVFEVTGIILSAMPVGEYDRRIVLLTREFGKISAFAKGARKPNSPLVGITRAFIFGTFEVYRGRDSYTIYKASAKTYFEEIVSDLDAVCYACYLAEIADYYGRENLDAKDSINLLYISLKALANKNIKNQLIRYIYELRMIAMNGECPDFFTCHGCGKEDDLTVYSLSGYGVYCRKCANDIYDGVRISPSTLYTLQYIVTAPLNKLFTFSVSDEVLLELKLVSQRICSTAFDKKFKSSEMLSMD